MRKNNQLNEVKADVGIMLASIFEFYSENLKKEQGMYLRDSILEIGFMLTSLDFHLFKQYAIEGKYKNRVDLIEGKEFAIKFFKLTPDVLIDWLKVYIFERGEVFANSQIKPKNEVITESQAKVVEIFANAITKVKEIKLSEEDQYKQDLKEKVQTIWNEFKALQMEQDSRLVEVNGKHYDYNEFLKLRTNGE